MSKIIIRNSGKLVVSNGVVSTGPEFSNIFTDDFESYSVGGFPQGSWSTFLTHAGWSASVVASGGAFGTQNIALNAFAGGGSFVSVKADATGNFIDGTVSCHFSKPNTASANFQPGLLMQALNTSNYMELRYRGSISSLILREIIGGTANLRFTSAAVALTADTDYFIKLTTSGTTADIGVFLSDETTPVISNTGISIAGGVSGKSGLVLAGVSNSLVANFDNFTASPV